jgi:hypothetical protein
MNCLKGVLKLKIFILKFIWWFLGISKWKQLENG